MIADETASLTALTVLLGGRVAGVLERPDASSPLVFAYDDAWRDDAAAIPLSLSLPLAGRRFSGDAVEYYLRGLLPDDAGRLARIAAHYGVTGRDSFSLLAQIGEDCAGAVQFARPERLDALAGKGPEHITWMTEADLAEEIRSLRAQNSGDGEPSYEAEFSLPGALAKVALRWDPRRKRWGRPQGRAPTTHIVKPPRTGLPYHNENEHLCLELARGVGLDAASSRVLRVGGESAIVVERYDRRWRDGFVERVHQEDMSQALGVDPELKYARQGAPTLAQIARLLLDWSAKGAEDVLRLFRAVALNWVVVGTDAHPRNYSVLISADEGVRLAPLYDIASAMFLPKQRRKIDPDERKLAMAIGGALTVGNVTRTSWEAEARAAGLRPTRVLDAVAATVEAIAGTAERVAGEATARGDTPGDFAEQFRRAVTVKARQRLAALA